MSNKDRDNMSHQVSRRTFLCNSAIISAAATGTFIPGTVDASELSPAKTTAVKASGRTLEPKMLLQNKAALSKPLLGPSQLSFRLGLARARTAIYPMDSMEFIMMDLECPDGRSRHAHRCTGDLSGRTFEFLSCAEGVDGKNDPRLDDLFGRILKLRRPSGIIGHYDTGSGGITPAGSPPESDPLVSSCTGRHSCGLLRYYELTGDPRALEAAVGVGNCIWAARDAW